jgi:hypothetical protein
LNAKPINVWLTDGEQPVPNDVAATKRIESTPQVPPPAPAKPDDTEAKAQPPSTSTGDSKPHDVGPPASPVSAPEPVRDTSAQALEALQSSIQSASDRMLKELAPEAHFVAYAPPTFIAFRRQAYLELSLDTVLSEPAGTSRYKLAALAFDDHISPLIRRVLPYFPGDQNFDGISFSTTVRRPPAKPGVPATKPLSVEFFFPLRALRCYEAYDCTGQQLLDAGTVLINGERIGLDLQVAESGGRS